MSSAHPSSPSIVYGPYLCGDGRRRVTMHYQDGRKTTTALARYVLECHLGRMLSPEETVDHIDNNKANDNLSNLQILSMADNIKKSITPAKTVQRSCPQCGVDFSVRLRRIQQYQRKRGHRGPFCSKSCAGRYSMLHSSRAIQDRNCRIQCGVCGNEAVVSVYRITANKKLGKAGPFCSRKCAGVYAGLKSRSDSGIVI